MSDTRYVHLGTCALLGMTALACAGPPAMEGTIVSRAPVLYGVRNPDGSTRTDSVPAMLVADVPNASPDDVYCDHLMTFTLGGAMILHRNRLPADIAELTIGRQVSVFTASDAVTLASCPGETAAQTVVLK